MRHDVVIIGSGLGGLVCASVLSHAGKNVLVLERQAQPGGCMQSYRRGDFSFDTGLHYVGGLAEGQRMHRIFSYLGLMDLPWQRLDAEGFDLITIGNKTFPFAEGYRHFADTLAGFFPDEREALNKYVELLKKIDEVSFGSDDAYRLFGRNAYDYLCHTFRSPLLVNVLAGSALKMELRKESLPLFSFAHGNSAFIQSSWRLRGEGNLLVNRLISNIRANGGDVVCRAEVEELVADSDLTKKRVIAAKCNNGEVYEADTFISDIHPASTFDLVKTPDLLKKVFRKRMAIMENTIGMLTVSLIIQPDAIKYFNHNQFVYLTEDVWMDTLRMKPAEVDRVMLCCRPPDKGDYTRQIDLLTPMTWERCRQWADTTVGHRGNEYLQMKELVARQCIALAERVIPQLGGKIVAKYVSTPLTYRDYTASPEGSAYGVRKDCRNLVLTMLSPQTPIENLLLTGQNLMLHGVEGVTMTALLTCAALLGNYDIQQIIKE